MATAITSAAGSSSCPRADGSRPVRSCRQPGIYISRFRFLFTDFPENPRRQEPAQRAGSGGRQRGDVDAADRAFFELERPAHTEQAAGELADAGLVADDRDVMTPVVLRQLLDNRVMR